MHKGAVVEEGDHESLMRARGTYYGLVEQQNLLRAEEEEQLAFERNESVTLVQAHQTEENQLDIPRRRASTIISLTPSVMAELYGKKKHLTADEDVEEEDGKEKKKKVKMRVKSILIKMIILGEKT
jgi:hypothetical protein